MHILNFYKKWTQSAFFGLTFSFLLSYTIIINDRLEAVGIFGGILNENKKDHRYAYSNDNGIAYGRCR